jgi:hypothetical protein
MNIEEFVEKHTEKLSINHQFAKLIIGSVVGFVAQQMTEKAYVAVVETIQRNRRVDADPGSNVHQH